MEIIVTIHVFTMSKTLMQCKLVDRVYNCNDFNGVRQLIKMRLANWAPN